jgi:hypothetical protein
MEPGAVNAPASTEALHITNSLIGRLKYTAQRSILQAPEAYAFIIEARAAWQTWRQ